MITKRQKRHNINRHGKLNVNHTIGQLLILALIMLIHPTQSDRGWTGRSAPGFWSSSSSSSIMNSEEVLEERSPHDTNLNTLKNGDTTIRKQRRIYETTFDDTEFQNKVTGSGREFDIFSHRGGSSNTSLPPSATTNTYPAKKRRKATTTVPRRQTPFSSSSSPSPSSSASGSSSRGSRNPFVAARTWLRENQSSLPRIQVRVEPNTTLKLRKRFRPLFKTEVTLGADFNTQLGVWQFKSSWEDKIIGGRLMLAGRELQLSKTWLLSVGAVEDLVTRLRLRAAIDLGTGKSYARLGFRTERLSPINVVEGFTLLRQLPLDGPEGHVKLEVKANFAFPEPEIEYSSSQRTIVGMGDVEVNIDELNLLLEY